MQKISELLRRNIEFKIISLVLAIIFWLWITSQPDAAVYSKNSMNVPLDIRNQPANLIIVSNIPPITVRINNTQGVSVADLYAYVDLTGAEAGQQSFEVKMNKPEGVEIESISPKSVVLKLDLVKDKIVPILSKISGKPASGFTAGKEVISPSVVNVRGPTSILDNLESVTVEVDISGAKESIRVARPVKFEDVKNEGIFAPDPNQNSLNAFPDTVEILIPVYPSALASKTVPLRVLAGGQPAEGMMVRSIAPLPASAQVLGDENVLKGIQYIDLGKVDVSGLSSNRTIEYALDSIGLPEGVSFQEGTRISVLVEIASGPVQKTIEGVGVTVRNIPEGLEAAAISPIGITVRGYPETVNALDAGSISAWMDATGLEAGSYPGTIVYWSAPAGVTVLGEPKAELVLTGPPPAETE